MLLRLVTGIRWCEHITPAFHWLPMRQQIEFKVAVLVYKSLNALSLQYLMDDCQLSQPLADDDFDRPMLLHLTLPEPA